MALKQISIFCAFTLLIMSKAASQRCGSLDKLVKYKSRKYYFVNEWDSIPLAPRLELLDSIAPQDTILIKEIIQKGTKITDFTSFFRQKGISISPIRYDQFIELPDDTVYLTKRETRLKKRFDELWEEEGILGGTDKSHESVDRKLNKRNITLYIKSY